MNTHSTNVADRGATGSREPGRYEIEVLDACVLYRDRQPVALKPREQRLVAALALHADRPRSRGYLAGLLWPEVTEARAAGSLRSAVWGLRRCAPRLLVHPGGQLGLNPDASVDVRRLSRVSNRIIDLAEQDLAEQDLGDPAAGIPSDCLAVLTTGELLPGWYEDWVLAERERLQQLRLAALEALAELLMDAGNPVSALAAARAATEIDPLCESAQRAVVRIQLGNGNYCAAVQQYLQFRRTVLAELGVGPSVQFERLIRPVLEHSRRGRRSTDVAPARAVSP